MSDTPKSDFQLAIEAAHGARTEHPFDVSGYFGVGGRAIPKIAIRRPTLLEKIHATDEAHKLVKKLCNEPEARQDPIVFDELKVTCLLSRAVRTVGSASKHSYPAFGGPEEMARTMPAEQIGALANLLNTVKRRESPTPVDISDDAVEAIAVALANNAGAKTLDGQRANDVMLAGIVERDELHYLLEAMADKLMTARADLAAYVKEQAIKDGIAADAKPDPEDA